MWREGDAGSGTASVDGMVVLRYALGGWAGDRVAHDGTMNSQGNKEESGMVRKGGCLSRRRGRRLSCALAIAASGALIVFASSASAQVVVSLTGLGAGTVTSNPPGIDCSDISGSPGPSCSASFGFEFVQLTATPGTSFQFTGWGGSDPFGGFFGPPCDEGTANPCTIIDPALFGEPPTHITANFACTPPLVSPRSVTGETSVGEDPLLRTLEGQVNPEGCGLEESFFEYGPTTQYGFTTPTVPHSEGIGRGSALVAVTAETETLEPNTSYHYRLVAVGPGGTARGEDRMFNTGTVPLGECPNEQIRREQGARTFRLPDCMALEEVSPPEKHSLPAYRPDVSATDSRVTFLSQAALGDHPGGIPPNVDVPYVASRSSSGWTSQSTVPEKGLSFLWESASRPSFTPDFSRWFGLGATKEQDQRGIDQPYDFGLDGFFGPMSKPLVPLTVESTVNTDNESEVVKLSEFQGASADHSHLYFKPGGLATYLPGDPDPGPERGANVYLARSGGGGNQPVELLQRDRTGAVWGGSCGARLGGIGSVANAGLPAPNGFRNQGAISADGSLTYLSARASQAQTGPCDETSNKLRILQRLETPTGPQIYPLFGSECSRPSLPDPPGPCQQISGDDFYQGASLDQTKVYFTTNRQLANSDSDGSSAECSVLFPEPGCDLYLYDRNRPPAERLVQVSAGEELGPGIHEAGSEARVYNGITAISADGTHVYFVAAGVLVDRSNPVGDHAEAGEPNLYLWDSQDEELAFIGTLAPPTGLDDPGDAIIFSNEGNGLWGGQGTWSNDAYPVPVTGGVEGSGPGGDGHELVFESKADLTPNDRDGRHLDVYRYDAGGPSLECLSCLPGSSAASPDEAPFDVEPRGEKGALATDFAEVHRWVSEGGQEVAFVTPEPLLPGDVNGMKDFYLWRQGSLVRLPGRPYLGESSKARDAGPVLSHDGSTVAFATATPLLPQDGDKTSDVYVARVGGGYPNPSAPEECEPGDGVDECQQMASPPPAVSTTTEAVRSGNPKPRHCRKRKIRRKGRCIAKHKRHGKKRHRTHGKKRHRTSRQTSADRRVAK